MRPFKFFFFIALGLMGFFFIARFVIPALFIAAMLSFFFFLFRRARYFLRGRYQDDHPWQGYRQAPRGLSEWRSGEDWLSEDYDIVPDGLTDYREIKVR